jgi:hypothetical protein
MLTSYKDLIYIIIKLIVLACLLGLYENVISSDYASSIQHAVQIKSVNSQQNRLMAYDPMISGNQ